MEIILILKLNDIVNIAESSTRNKVSRRYATSPTPLSGRLKLIPFSFWPSGERTITSSVVMYVCCKNATHQKFMTNGCHQCSNLHFIHTNWRKFYYKILWMEIKNVELSQPQTSGNICKPLYYANVFKRFGTSRNKVLNKFAG